MKFMLVSLYKKVIKVDRQDKYAEMDRQHGVKVPKEPYSLLDK